jgi:hypothetical protein
MARKPSLSSGNCGVTLMGDPPSIPNWLNSCASAVAIKVKCAPAEDQAGASHAWPAASADQAQLDADSTKSG